MSYYLELQEENTSRKGRGIVIRRVNRSFQFVTRPENEEYIERLCTPVQVKKADPVGAGGVSHHCPYKQPVTRGN